MAMLRVFQNPDGSLRIMRPNPRLKELGESETAFCARICDADVTKDAALVGLPFVDVDEADLPPTRDKRYAWRVKNGKVVEDPTVPDPPNPKRDLRVEAARAATVDELKAVILKVIGE